ncbi:MAG: alanine racemase [Proteobacteria bacterium]|nr:alanine racemase [Pseudomonadota bacterium]MBU1390069.1 alanine racemase [Pseudomonadota bacterium]MBU1544980.1 alanine racemase [Pseudomonadota bacterium]MBU2430308.1 alanine racemase [Pseudomonadota bacterium]MBU2480670.1 alanine racemase [Pseudomonadota bacterium]
MTPLENQTVQKISAPFFQDFIRDFFDRKHIFLDAAQQFGSPLYILESDVLRDRAKAFRQAFEKDLPETAFYFAMKSNNLPHVSKIMIEQGFGIDVSSGLELATALKLNAENIIFSGPGKTDPELEKAIEHNDRVTVLIDSPGELKRLKSILEIKKKVLNIGVRINCNPEGLWRKFGISLEELNPFYEAVKKSPYLNFSGLQFHSSWNLFPDRQVEFIGTLGNQLGQMPKDFLKSIQFLDIGGGYWPPQGEWTLSDTALSYLKAPAAPIEFFAQHITGAIKDNIFPLIPCKICFEPGRWICNDAMHILLKIIDRKANDLVITDAGTNTIGWERFETDYFPVLNLTRSAMTQQPCHILGSLCTPHDVWGYAYFGEDICENDILLIPTQGAYTYSLRQQFIKPLPKVVILDRSGSACIEESVD